MYTYCTCSRAVYIHVYMCILVYNYIDEWEFCCLCHITIVTMIIRHVEGDRMLWGLYTPPHQMESKCIKIP